MWRSVKCHYWLYVAFLVLSYVWGVVSFQNYLPSTNGVLIGLYSILLLAVGLLIWSTKVTLNQISVSTLLWLVFFLLFLAQPFLHTTVYFDNSLIFALSTLIVVLYSTTLDGLSSNQKRTAVMVVAVGILFAGLFTVAGQTAQALGVDGWLGSLFMKSTTRLAGNIAQPNQAAYVLVMAWSALIYLCLEYKEWVIKHQWHALLVVNFVSFLVVAGLGMSASRGGILLMVCAVLGAGLIYHQAIKVRIAIMLMFVPAMVAGYLVGTELLNTFNDQTSALGRLIGEGESLGLRKSLLQQALLAFQSSPITGVGWGNFKQFGLLNAEQLSWFTVAHHAHNLPAQIAAELGILGLLPLLGFIWIILRNFGFKLEYYKAFSHIILGLTFAYSLSEYPLWYFCFLLLTVFFIAIIDDGTIRLKFDFSKLVVVASACFVLISGYYIKQYYRYADVSYAIQSDLTNYEQKVFAYQDLPNVFGYSKYKELILYMLTPIDKETADKQIILGERVLSTYLSDFLMIKQADLLLMTNRESEAQKLWHAGCVFGDYARTGLSCVKVLEHLQEKAKEDARYQAHFDNLKQWYTTQFAVGLPNHLQNDDNKE